MPLDGAISLDLEQILDGVSLKQTLSGRESLLCEFSTVKTLFGWAEWVGRLGWEIKRRKQGPLACVIRWCRREAKGWLGRARGL